MYITRQTIVADFSLSVNCKKERKAVKTWGFSAHFPQEKGGLPKTLSGEKEKTGNVTRACEKQGMYLRERQIYFFGRKKETANRMGMAAVYSL